MPPAPPTATAYLRVLRQRHFPVQASAGEYLAVMPPSCPENLWVHEPIGLWVVRRAHFPEAKLWSVLADGMDDGSLSLIHAPGAALLPHLLETRELSPAQAVRILARRRA